MNHNKVEVDDVCSTDIYIYITLT